MSLDKFNPNGVGSKNAGIFGLPHNEKEAEVIVIPVPWDVTTSYHAGTHIGPDSIREASPQLDLYHPDFPDLWKKGVFMPDNQAWIEHGTVQMRAKAEKIIQTLEDGEKLDADLRLVRKQINEESAKVTAWLKKKALSYLGKGKRVGVVGGDHSVPLGLMQALAETHEEYGILHIDAHHDLRNAYMGFTESHASIMYNALKIPQISSLVQVGIRDYCQEEVNCVNDSDGRVVVFYDAQLKEEKFTGRTWHEQCVEILRHLPENVYVSFDIDGLAPHLCPNTGTPVPGGLLYEEVVYLIKQVAKARNIIGFDLVEVSGDGDSIDANIGARLLWNLCGYATTSERTSWKLG